MARIIDADALRRKCAKVAAESWKMKMTAQVETVMNQFIDFIEEAPTVGGWISVKDRLPEDEYECLIITKGRWYYIGWFKGDIQKWVVDGVVWCYVEVTHWIKLPEPPKEDEDDAEQCFDFEGGCNSGGAARMGERAGAVTVYRDNSRR